MLINVHIIYVIAYIRSHVDINFENSSYETFVAKIVFFNNKCVIIIKIDSLSKTL